MIYETPLSIADAARRLRNGSLTAIELMERHLVNIDAWETTINSFITVCRDRALEGAAAADDLLRAGHDLGPLHGLAVAVKDNIDTQGVRTTYGSRRMRDHVPNSDAMVIARLKRAGAVVIGKANLHEFAAGGTTENPHYGSTRNPWSTGRFAAGSSGGSASAVASGACMAALGTDTGGSARLPAAMTGITGLRPTFGRVSNTGVFPLAWSLDTVGPMARSVDDVGVLLECISDPELPDPFNSSRAASEVASADGATGLSGVRIGLIGDFATTLVDNQVRQTFEEALLDLEGLGAQVLEVPAPPGFEHYVDWKIVRLVETAAVHQEWIAERPSDYGTDVADSIRSGLALPATDYARAQNFRRSWVETFSRHFAHFDAFATPTASFTATPVGQTWVDISGARMPLVDILPRYTGLASYLGAPAISIPSGFANYLPVGLQLIGAPFSEEKLLHIGRAYERVNKWHLHRPQMAEKPDS